MVCEFYYSWLLTAENTPSEVYPLVSTILDLLYGSYPHGINLKIQICFEISLDGAEIRVIELDFSPCIPKSEVEELLVKRFLSFFGKEPIFSISKVIVLGYSGSCPFG